MIGFRDYVAFLEAVKKHRPCQKCGSTTYNDIRAGLCDACAFPVKEGLRKDSRYYVEIEYREDHKYYGLLMDRETETVFYRTDGKRTWDDAYDEVIGQAPPDQLEEAAYAGNVGAMEMFKFYQVATQQQKQLMAQYIKEKLFDKAWDLLKQVTGVQLKDVNARA